MQRLAALYAALPAEQPCRRQAGIRHTTSNLPRMAAGERVQRALAVSARRRVRPVRQCRSISEPDDVGKPFKSHDTAVTGKEYERHGSQPQGVGRRIHRLSMRLMSSTAKVDMAGHAQVCIAGCAGLTTVRFHKSERAAELICELAFSKLKALLRSARTILRRHVRRPQGHMQPLRPATMPRLLQGSRLAATRFGNSKPAHLLTRAKLIEPGSISRWSRGLGTRHSVRAGSKDIAPHWRPRSMSRRLGSVCLCYNLREL